MKAVICLVIITAQVFALPAEEQRNEMKNRNETKDIEKKEMEGIKLTPEAMNGIEQNNTFKVIPYAAFVGDACPTGKAKIQGICVEIDQ